MIFLIELPEVDAIVGTGDYDKIAEVIREAFKGEKPVICGHNDRTPDERLPRILSTPSYTAYLKIADGCDNNCTYCAIPMIRGHFRSRKIEDIVEEAENIQKAVVRNLYLLHRILHVTEKICTANIRLIRCLKNLSRLTVSSG